MSDKQKELAAIAEEFSFKSVSGKDIFESHLMVEEIWRLRQTNAEAVRIAVEAHKKAEMLQRENAELEFAVRGARREIDVLHGACPECGLGANGEFCACDK